MEVAMTPDLFDFDLVEIDLSKGEKSNHPDVKVGRSETYLALHGGKLVSGYFTKVWFGLNFQVRRGYSFQFDTPGYNSSQWQRLWWVVNIPRS